MQPGRIRSTRAQTPVLVLLHDVDGIGHKVHCDPDDLTRGHVSAQAGIFRWKVDQSVVSADVSPK